MATGSAELYEAAAEHVDSVTIDRHRGIVSLMEELEAITQIVDVMLRRARERLEGLELTPAAKETLAEKGYDPTFGARPPRRAIQRLVEDRLSDLILRKGFRAGEMVVVDAENHEVSLR